MGDVKRLLLNLFLVIISFFKAPENSGTFLMPCWSQFSFPELWKTSEHFPCPQSSSGLPKLAAKYCAVALMLSDPHTNVLHWQKNPQTCFSGFSSASCMISCNLWRLPLHEQSERFHPASS